MTAAIDLIFDEDTFRATANAVITHNKFMRDHRNTASLINFMKALAWDAFCNNSQGYCATGGFDLCCWRNPRDPEGIFRVRASVSAMLFKQLPDTE